MTRPHESSRHASHKANVDVTSSRLVSKSQAPPLAEDLAKLMLYCGRYREDWFNYENNAHRAQGQMCQCDHNFQIK